ncbi:hypothetical protein ACFOWE_32675 [Planomonospora corallina]|uniref:Uncharacterized protein n=1 Tax=Planomonospora corallina TaxID=1806052 RepID=A0ABV8IKS3_9ACTN
MIAGYRRNWERDPYDHPEPDVRHTNPEAGEKYAMGRTVTGLYIVPGGEADDHDDEVRITVTPGDFPDPEAAIRTVLYDIEDLQPVDSGPLSGAAFCRTFYVAVVCYWATETTFGSVGAPGGDMKQAARHYRTLRTALEKERPSS